MQPGGRLVAHGIPLRFLINRAFNTNNNEEVVGIPNWADEGIEITAKTPATAVPAGPGMDPEVIAPMIRSLLTDRFKMTYHTEHRPVTAYSLVQAKPKMKKADLASRTSCRQPNPGPGTRPNARVLTCRNLTMAQFAERLQNMTPELNWPKFRTRRGSRAAGISR